MGNSASSVSYPDARNVLYLGIGYDILTPLILCPNFTTLYVLDWDDEKQSIIEHLTSGTQVMFAEDTKDTTENKYDLTLEPSVDLELIPNKRGWELRFKYKNVPRVLKFFKQDFSKKWPEVVTVHNFLNIT